MREIRFVNIVSQFCVIAGSLFADQAMSFGGRHAKIDDEIFGGQGVHLIFKLLEPLQEFGAFFGRDTSALVREIRADVTVGDDGLSGGEIGFDARFGFETVAGVEQGREVGVHGFEGTEISVEVLAGHSAEKSVVTRETDLRTSDAAGGEGAHEHFELGAFAGAVNSFENDKFSAGRHRIAAQSSIGAQRRDCSHMCKSRTG